MMYHDSYFAEVKFDSAEAFMECILKTYARNDLMDFVGIGTKHAIFRGLDDEKYENLPKAFRTTPEWQKFDYYPPKPMDTSAPDVTAERARFLFDVRFAELRSVFNFLNYSDKIGIPTPLDFYILQSEFEEALACAKGAKIDYTKRKPDLSREFPGKGVRETFALAQHYGVPTRLLDWTESPLVAMFFAAAKPWKELLGYADGGGTAKYISVYGLGTSESFLDEIKIDLVSATRFQNPRLRAQAGLFALDPLADKFFMDAGRWQSLDERVRDLDASISTSAITSRSPESRLLKFNLVGSESAKLARLLLDYNISLETMFPSLENAALAWGYRWKVMGGT